MGVQIAIESFANQYHHIDGSNFHFTLLAFTIAFVFILVRKFISNKLQILELKSIQEKNEKEILESKFKNLTSRLDSHFLFNTLNLIHSYLKTKPKQADEAIQNLGDSYRYLTEIHSEEISNLANEIEFLKNYLNLISLRLKNRFRFSLKLDKDLDKIILPSLILQPIVENSYIHGFKNKKGKSIIKIQIKKENDGAKILIWDNGIGLKKNPNDGVTIKTIQTRLGYFYKNVSLKLNSENNKGTELELIFTDKKN